MTKWWQQPQRIVQTNLRLVDASLDPDALAAELAEFGATAMLFNVGGIYAWYPTQLPLQPQNPRLATGEDLLERMIQAAHKRGIIFIGRYDLSKATRVAYDAHPEWFCCDPEGKPFEYNGTYQACVNGGWYHGQGIDVLKETLSRYEIDGLFFNMFGYLAVDYSLRSYGLCHCDNCRREFRSFADADLPASRDLRDGLYRRYLKFQDVTSKALQSSIYDVIKSIRPDVGISNMGVRSDFFRGEVNRRLDRPQPEWVHYSGEQARNFRSVGANAIRHSSALTHFIDFPWRYSAETGAAQALRLAQQLANGADPHYYFMGLPSAQQDRKPLASVRDIFSFYRRHEALYSALEPEARIALYASHKSRRFHPSAGSSIRGFRGAYRALLEAGLAFDIINDERATRKDFVATHSQYDTIVLAGAGCMSAEEAEALDAFVEAGGTLVVMGDTGAHDEMGELLDNRRLKCLPIETAPETIESRGGYVEVPSGAVGGLDSELILLDGPYHLVTPKADAETEYAVLLPQRFGPPELCFPEGAADAELPGVVVGWHGRGHCIFVPWQPDVLYYEQSLAEHRELIADLASRFTRAPLAQVSQPGRVELTVQRHRETGDLLIHVINYSGNDGNNYSEPVEIHGMKLLLNGVRPRECSALVAQKPLVVEPGINGGSIVALPPVRYFEAISLTGGDRSG